MFLRQMRVFLRAGSEKILINITNNIRESDAYNLSPRHLPGAQNFYIPKRRYANPVCVRYMAAYFPLSAMSCSCVPCSAIAPSSIKRIHCESRMVESRCAMMKDVAVFADFQHGAADLLLCDSIYRSWSLHPRSGSARWRGMGPRDGDQLAFSLRKLLSTLRKDGIIPRGQALDKSYPLRPFARPGESAPSWPRDARSRCCRARKMANSAVSCSTAPKAARKSCKR